MLSKRKDIEMSEVNNGQVKIQIQKGLGITHALKKLVEEQQMELSGGKITASEWNSVMDKLAEIQENRKANGQASIFNGGTYKTKSGWQNSFVVHPNQEIEFNAEEISAVYEAMGAKFSSKALVSSTPTPPSAVDENIPKKDENPPTADSNPPQATTPPSKGLDLSKYTPETGDYIFRNRNLANQAVQTPSDPSTTYVYDKDGYLKQVLDEDGNEIREIYRKPDGSVTYDTE